MGDCLTRHGVILQCIKWSNHCDVHLKLIGYCMPTILQIKGLTIYHWIM